MRRNMLEKGGKLKKPLCTKPKQLVLNNPEDVWTNFAIEPETFEGNCIKELASYFPIE